MTPTDSSPGVLSRPAPGEATTNQALADAWVQGYKAGLADAATDNGRWRHHTANPYARDELRELIDAQEAAGVPNLDNVNTRCDWPFGLEPDSSIGYETEWK